MAWKTMVTELLWFLRGDTNIKFLVDNGCHIWDGDAYKNYLIEDAKVLPNMSKEKMTELGFRLTQEEFINKIKTDDEFAKKWGELGPVYGKQWRNWDAHNKYDIDPTPVDQITNLINDLKTNPDSRRLMVNAWNVGELDQMVLPPCHYGFQVYTRELSKSELNILYNIRRGVGKVDTNYSIGTVKSKDPSIPTKLITITYNNETIEVFH